MAKEENSENSDSDSSPVTLEEAISNTQRSTEEGREHLEGLQNYADETDAKSKFENLESIFEDVNDISVTVPDFLVERQEGDSGIDLPPPGGRRPKSPIDIPDLDTLDVEGLLAVIARIQLAQLTAQLDMADSLAPLSSITVSGTNSTEREDASQTVVPLSDEQAIPTRTLFIKASADNNKSIAFGDDEVDPNSGFILDAGESIVKEIDLRGQSLYMASEATGQEVQLLGMI